MTNNDILGRTVRFGDQTGKVIAIIDEPAVVIETDGFTHDRLTVPRRRVEIADEICDRCNGQGHVDHWRHGMRTEERCPRCHGTGYAVPE